MKNQHTTNTIDFTTGNVTGQLLRFATPFFLSGLLQIVYNMVDMIIVGQTLGKMGLSAVSIGGDVAGFLTFFAMGFSSAGQVIIAQFLGANEHKKLGSFIGTMFSFLMLLGVTLSVVCLFLREPILRVMNTPEEAFSEALAYSTICMAGLIFIYGYNTVSAILRGMGDSIRPFYFISIAAVLNILLDLLFVRGIGMGSAGAAAATVISQGVSFLLCGVYILRHKSSYQLQITLKGLFHIEGAMLARLVRLGIPMAIKFASVQFSKLFVNSWINSYSYEICAFAGIANKITNVSYLISGSFHMAGASMVGRNIGAMKYDRVKQIMFAVYKVSIILMAIMCIVNAFFPRQLYSLFTSEEDVIAVGMTFVPIAMIYYAACATRSGANALINGSGNYRINFLTAIFDGIVNRIGLSVLFGLVLDMRHTGFWLGDALAGFTPFVIGILFYFSGRWKKSSAIE